MPNELYIFMKKIVFIGGANHSGSTMIGAVLGAWSTPFKYFHAGEISSFFNNNSPKYGQAKAALNAPYGSFWKSVNYTVGYRNAYSELFSLLPEMEVLIDSSKTSSNLICQLDSSCVDIQSVICLVTFRQFNKIWESDEKREVPPSRRVKNLQHYQKLLSAIDDYGLPYYVLDIDKFLLNPRSYTEKICSLLGIPYFDGKEKYWLYPDAHLYGAITQRKHFRNPERAGFLVRSKSVSKDSRSFYPWENDRVLVETESRLIREAI